MSQISHRFPAILIGGPPHAGKSVLAHQLKKRLKEADIEFYGFSATPDGEGDWSHDSAPAVAQAQRRKGKFTPKLIDQLCRDIAQRPLPFLIDVGGRPEPWQQKIFDYCTHAILLVTDDESEQEWQTMMAAYNVSLMAVLRSQLEGESTLAAERPVVKGTMTGLKRHQAAGGPVFEAVFNRVKALFNYSAEDIIAMHQAQAPTDLVLVMRKLYQRLHPNRPGPEWQPQDLPGLLAHLPQNSPLGLYGSGPIWLFVAVACHAFPAEFYQFDGRCGWVNPVSFTAGSATIPIEIISRETSRYLHLKLNLPEDYLDYQPAMSLPLPPLPRGKGIIFDGKGSAWLYTGLARFYLQAPWLAVYQPKLNQSVVVFSREQTGLYKPGHLLDYTPIE